MVQDNVVIQVSQLVKDGTDGENKITEEFITTIESVAQELVGDGAIVEVITEDK